VAKGGRGGGGGGGIRCSGVESHTVRCSRGNQCQVRCASALVQGDGRWRRFCRIARHHGVRVVFGREERWPGGEAPNPGQQVSSSSHAQTLPEPRGERSTRRVGGGGACRQWIEPGRIPRPVGGPARRSQAPLAVTARPRAAAAPPAQQRVRERAPPGHHPRRAPAPCVADDVRPKVRHTPQAAQEEVARKRDTASPHGGSIGPLHQLRPTPPSHPVRTWRVSPVLVQAASRDDATNPSNARTSRLLAVASSRPHNASSASYGMTGWSSMRRAERVRDVSGSVSITVEAMDARCRW
jgi:hypothetical protein